MKSRIGIDIGGTKIEGILLDVAANVILRERIETPAGDYPATIDSVKSLFEILVSQTPEQEYRVGVCAPGSLSPTSGLLRNANSTCLNDMPLKQDLERALGCEIRMANDADCLAVSEFHNGALTGCRNAFAAILGTGVGGGVIANGRLLQGPQAIAGEWGHNPLPWMNEHEYPGRQCWCGQRGCVETWLSGPAMEADYLAYTDLQCSAESIAGRASDGDAACLEILSRYCHRLARALAGVINVLDPEIIVLGGGLSNIDHIYTAVPEIWHQWVFSDVVSTRLVRAENGDSSGVFGAAALWDA